MARRLPHVVDVVIPLAGAHGEVAALVAGMRDLATPYRLLLVDEATTELRQGALRKRLVANAGVECLWLRSRGRGVLAALAAAAAEAAGDIALLDPRVRVPADWLDRLRRCMDADPRIGIVGTWSTADRDAPGFMQRLALGGVWHAPDVVDQAVALSAVPVYPDAGIVAGPCVLVRRAVVEAARSAGRMHSFAGLSASAHAAGFRAVLADDAVAQHVPYGFDCGIVADDDVAVGAALAAVGTRDPIGPLRNVLATTLAMLERTDLPGILHVAHARGGGTERYIRDAIAATAESHRHYVLRIHADRWTLEDTRDDGFTACDWPRQGAQAGDAWLRDVCAWLRIDLVHVHSLVGSGDDFLAALREAAVPYLYTAHDMYVPCPTVYLIGSDGQYCNATTDPGTCRACLGRMPGLSQIDIVAWRERHEIFMNAARCVVAPSQWAADTLRAYFPDAPVQVIGHGAGVAVHDDGAPIEARELPQDAHRHVGLLGAIGPEKGSRRIDAMAQRIRERGLPLRLVVIGYTDHECRFQSEDQVLTVHGPYARGSVERLCDLYRIGVVAFPSIWPETFSYTLGEAWGAGRPVLVPARGALGERVEAAQAGWTLDATASVDAWLDALVDITAPERADELATVAQRARAAAAQWRAADEPAIALYAQMAVRGDATPRASHSQHAIHAAACRAEGVVPLPPVTPQTGDTRVGAATEPLPSIARWWRRLRGVA